MPASPIEDWTRGPAKWAAVIVLALGGFGALAWSIAAGSARAGRLVRADAGGELGAVVESADREIAASLQGASAMAAPDSGDRSAWSPAEGTVLGPPTPGVVTEPDEPLVIIEPKPESDASGLEPAPASRKINLNTATAGELELLPGIGPALARRIIDDRTKLGKFRGVDDLDRVPGIGARTIEKLRPMVVAE